MTKHPEEPQDSQLLDLLVDGELPNTERQALLAHLEHEPDGWRRCALAFLEAQTWQDEFRAILSSPKVQKDALAPTSAHPLKSKSWLTGVRGTCLAMAASFLLAFWLGTSWRGPSNAGLVAPENERLTTSLPAEGPTVVAPSLPGVASSHSTPNRVNLVVDDGPARPASRVELPVIEVADPRGLQLLHQPGPLPDELRRVLEQLGNQVRVERQLVPFEMQDGRRGIVPVDAVEVLPVSTTKFQ